MSQDAIAEELGRTKATVNWHARRMSVVGAPYAGRAFIVRVLGYSGVRNSELCDLRIGHVRLHDPGGARFHIPDAKTETGVRVVEMSPDLAEAFVDHLDRLRRAGQPTGPDDYVVQNLRGGRISRQRIAEIVREAAALASETTSAARPPAAAADHAAHAAPDLHLDRAARQQLRRQVGHEPGRPRRLEDDASTSTPSSSSASSATTAVRFDAIIRAAEEQMHGEGIDDAEVAEAAETASDHDEEE